MTEKEVHMFEVVSLYKCINCGALYEEEWETKPHCCRIARKTHQLGTGML